MILLEKAIISIFNLSIKAIENVININPDKSRFLLLVNLEYNSFIFSCLSECWEF